MIPALNSNVWLELNDLDWDIKSSLHPVSIINQIRGTQRNHHNTREVWLMEMVKGVKSLVWLYQELTGWQLGVLLLTGKQSTNEHVPVDNKIKTEGVARRTEHRSTVNNKIYMYQTKEKVNKIHDSSKCILYSFNLWKMRDLWYFLLRWNIYFLLTLLGSSLESLERMCVYCYANFVVWSWLTFQRFLVSFIHFIEHRKTFIAGFGV